jgi:hypothetical protein
VGTRLTGSGKLGVINTFETKTLSSFFSLLADFSDHMPGSLSDYPGS